MRQKKYMLIVPETWSENILRRGYGDEEWSVFHVIHHKWSRQGWHFVIWNSEPKIQLSSTKEAHFSGTIVIFLFKGIKHEETWMYCRAVLIFYFMPWCLKSQPIMASKRHKPCGANRYLLLLISYHCLCAWGNTWIERKDYMQGLTISLKPNSGHTKLASITADIYFAGRNKTFHHARFILLKSVCFFPCRGQIWSSAVLAVLPCLFRYMHCRFHRHQRYVHIFTSLPSWPFTHSLRLGFVIGLKERCSKRWR